MVSFSQLISEALGKFPKRQESQALKKALTLPPKYSPEESERRSGLISKFLARRREDYPGKFNFILTDEFKGLLVSTWESLAKDPIAFLIYGDPGVGKSQIIKSSVQKLTQLENKKFPATTPEGKVVERKFIEWDSLQPNEKTEVMMHPERYYALLDIRTAFFTTASLEGLPIPKAGIKQVKPELGDLNEINQAEFFDVIPQRFIAFITNPKAAGVFFLDEINQGSTEVKNIFLKVILDRKFQDLPLSPRILVLAAANIGKAFQGQDMSPALASRFKGAVLVPDPEEWYYFAEQSGVAPEIIDFVRNNPDENFYRYPSTRIKNVQFPNPRAIVRFNTAFKSIQEEFDSLVAANDVDAQVQLDLYRKVEVEASSYIDSQWGKDFVAYLKQINEFDIPALAADETAYKSIDELKLGTLTQVLIRKLMPEIDDAITSPSGGVFGDPKTNIPTVDAKKLSENLANYKTILLRLNDANLTRVLQGVKRLDPTYARILLNYAKTDKALLDRFFKIEKITPAKVKPAPEQI